MTASWRASLAAGFAAGGRRTAIDLPAGLGLRDSWALRALRVCAFLVAVGAVTSPPLANVAAGLCLIFFAALPDLRARVAAIRGQPMIRALGVLALVLVASTLHALVLGAGWGAAIQGLVGWRHLLLLAVIAAAFAEVAPRQRFIRSFVAFCALAAAIMMVAVVANWSKDPNLYPPGLLFRNTVTQALLLALGGFLALAAGVSTLTRTAVDKSVFLVSAAVIVGVLVGYQTGRSGLVALIVMVAVGALLRFRGGTAIAVAAAVLALAVTAVMFSPVQKKRFGEAVQELIERDKTAADTSIDRKAHV